MVRHLEILLVKAEERWVLLFGEQLLDVKTLRNGLLVHFCEHSGVAVSFYDLSAFEVYKH